MRGFEDFAVSAQFYPVAGLDLFSRPFEYHVDTKLDAKSTNPTTIFSLADSFGRRDAFCQANRRTPAKVRRIIGNPLWFWMSLDSFAQPLLSVHRGPSAKKIETLLRGPRGPIGAPCGRVPHVCRDSANALQQLVGNGRQLLCRDTERRPGNADRRYRKPL